MKHVLITRFALRFVKGHRNNKYEGRNWVEYRMGLFRDYCLPSVQAQTFQDFDWWFLVDYNFSGLMNKHVNELNRHGKCLFMTDKWSEKQDGVGKTLSKYYKDKWVCSTRLDSDDMIHNEFMALVADAAKEKEEWISFPHGYFLKEATGKYMSREYLTNPFISYVEYADPFTSVMKINHIRVGKRGPGIQTIVTPAWVQVDHGDNIKNDAGKRFSNFDAEALDAEELDDRFTYKRR